MKIKFFRFFTSDTAKHEPLVNEFLASVDPTDVNVSSDGAWVNIAVLYKDKTVGNSPRPSKKVVKKKLAKKVSKIVSKGTATVQ